MGNRECRSTLCDDHIQEVSMDRAEQVTGRMDNNTYLGFDANSL